MKMVVLTYLEGDESCVERMLAALDVVAFSRLSIEGHGAGGAAGWYPSTAPYRSELILVFSDDVGARRILDGVEACTEVQDPRHPIRAFMVAVEDSTSCGCEESDAEKAGPPR